MASYISATNVNLTFAPKNRAPVNALNNFNVDVEEGEFVSIVGPSGCGKSTFIRCINRMHELVDIARFPLGRDPTRDPIADGRQCFEVARRAL